MYRTLLVWPNDILEFVLIEEHPTKYSYYILRYKHLFFAEPHVASNVRYIAFPLSTNSLLTPSNVRYISFQRNLQLKIHPSSYHFGYRESTVALKKTCGEVVGKCGRKVGEWVGKMGCWEGSFRVASFPLIFSFLWGFSWVDCTVFWLFPTIFFSTCGFFHALWRMGA